MQTEFSPRTAPAAAAPEGRYAALYVRVSTGKQKDNWSVKDQYALAKLGEDRGLRVVAYDEQGVSGETIEDRPTMSRLLADVRARKVAAIICVATSRLSRDEDIIDTLTIQAACRENDTIVITPEQVYDYSTRAGTIFGQIRAIFDADYKQSLVKATAGGQYAKARDGGFVSGVAPFGYRLVYDVPHKDGRPRARLDIDSEEAAIVRQVFSLYVDGRREKDGTPLPMSIDAVTAFLNTSGLRLRTRRTQKNPAKRRPDGTLQQAGELRLFERQDVRRILLARCYLGVFTYGEGHRSKWVRDQAPIEIHRPELQIVDVTVWQRAQAIRTQRAAGPRRTACSTRPLAGLLRCPLCGGLMSSATTAQRHTPNEYARYWCRTRRMSGRAGCLGYTLVERAALPAVADLLVEQLARLRLDRFLDRASEEAANETEGAVAQRVLVELQQTEEKIQRLVRSVADGVFTPAEARDVKTELMGKAERLKARLTRLRQRGQARDDLLEAVAYVQGNLPGLVRTLDGHRFRQLARLVFSEVVVVGEGMGKARTGRVRSYQLTEQYREMTNTFGASGFA